MKGVNGGEAKSDRMGCSRGRGSVGFKYKYVRLGFVISKQPSMKIKSAKNDHHFTTLNVIVQVTYNRCERSIDEYWWPFI